MLTPGAHCRQQGAALSVSREKGGVGRALLRSLSMAFWALAFMVWAFSGCRPCVRPRWADVSVGAEGAHLGHADILPVVPHPHDVGVDAPSALRQPAQDRQGKRRPGGRTRAAASRPPGPLAGARRAAEDVRVGAPAQPSPAPAAASAGVARQPGQVHKDSDPLKPLDIHHEDGGAAHHDLHGHGGSSRSSSRWWWGSFACGCGNARMMSMTVCTFSSSRR